MSSQTPQREIVVRPATPADLLQCTHILNYWTLESNWALIENPYSLADMVELYRKIKSKGLPYFVACWADDQTHVLGFIYPVPESYRLIRIPGIVSNALFIEPGLKGLKLFERLLFPYLKVLLAFPWFRGSLSDTNAGNTHIHHKHSPSAAVGAKPAIIIKGALYKRGEWHDQGIEFFSREVFEMGMARFEDLMNVKL